ncbi:MAG: hypothetical protein ACI848_000984 [Roseivirga sp.]|jgi:hypothetical protein
MTLYQFNILTEDNKLKTVWDIGEFLINLYLINTFFNSAISINLVN